MSETTITRPEPALAEQAPLLLGHAAGYAATARSRSGCGPG
jgi:hypothetical protein